MLHASQLQVSKQFALARCRHNAQKYATPTCKQTISGAAQCNEFGRAETFDLQAKSNLHWQPSDQADGEAESERK